MRLCWNCGELLLSNDFMRDMIVLKCKCGNIDISIPRNVVDDVMSKRYKRRLKIRHEMRDSSLRFLELAKYKL